MPRRVNLGCGPYPRPQADGWINIDANPRHRPDIVRDVRRGLPFDGSSCDTVECSHFLEHLAHDDLIWLIGEIYRVLKPGGEWWIVVPLGNSGELDHKMQFTESSFDILLRPEAADYFQVAMAWREVAGSRAVRPEPTRPQVMSLHLKLEAVK
jgi:predicted SAM-dependent methyltransferase